METNVPSLASSQWSSTPIPVDGVDTGSESAVLYTYQYQQQSSTSAHSADAMTSSYADSDEVGAMTEFVSEWSDDEDLLAREARDNHAWDANAALGGKRDSGRRVSRSSFDAAEPAAEIERVYQEAIALMEGPKAMQKPRSRMPLAGRGVAGMSTSKKQWLDEAKQQKRLLLHAKSEGLKLRTEIRIEKERARSLYRILMKRLDKIALLRKELYYAIPRSVQFADTGSLYARLLHETNAMVEHADAMKQLLRTRVPLPTKNGSFRDWRVNYDATFGVQLEFIDSEELPFPQYYVNNAMQDMYRSYELDKIIRQACNTFNLLANDGFVGAHFWNDGEDAGMAVHLGLRQWHDGAGNDRDLVVRDVVTRRFEFDREVNASRVPLLSGIAGREFFHDESAS